MIFSIKIFFEESCCAVWIFLVRKVFKLKIENDINCSFTVLLIPWPLLLTCGLFHVVTVCLRDALPDE